MKYIILSLLFFIAGQVVIGQETIDTVGGTVSYETSQNIYVRFQSTKDFRVGDTLYSISEGRMVPIMVVKFISSTSCAGSPFSGKDLKTGDRVLARIKAKENSQPPPYPVTQDLTSAIKEIQDQNEAEQVAVKEEQKKSIRQTERLRGRISAASYVNFSDHPAYDQQKMRYTMTFNADRIGNTGLSAESYISFRHTINEWQEVKDHFKKAFKIYSLAFQYNINEGTRIWFGRKINFNISNIGAIDGLQAEKKWTKTLVGVFAGSRPDPVDYDFNSTLMQIGAYAGHTISGKNGTIQNTIAFAEQRNHNMTDRRFAYFQHLNSAIKDVHIFASFEFDLYKLENEKPKNTLDITSIYFSIRYKVSDKLSLFGSYDARNNIIYYETYQQNIILQMLEDETRQGYRFNVNFRPLPKITLGANAGYRFQKDTPGSSKNLNSYLTVSRIPAIQGSATLSATFIQSAFLEGKIFGLRYSRDIISGKLFGELEYRLLEYKYNGSEFPLKQSIAGGNFTWRFTKRLSFSINYEGEIQNNLVNNRIFTNIVQRF